MGQGTQGFLPKAPAPRRAQTERHVSGVSRKGAPLESVLGRVLCCWGCYSPLLIDAPWAHATRAGEPG